MIRLTRIDYDGNKKPIIIDAESIESIEDGEKRTELTTKRGWTFYVVESREEVVRKVLEWQIELGARMAAQIEELRRGDADIGFVWNTSEEKLYKLAGLEE